MNRLRGYLLLGVLVLEVVLILGGVMMWVRTDYGVTNRFVTNPLRIPEGGYYWTWGVDGEPGVEPDAWHFHVIFDANKTADVVLLWKLNERILWEKNSAKIDEGFDVTLPKTTESWRWDWLIRNPDDSVLGVENFTVIHYPIKYPERQLGSISLAASAIVLLAIPIAKAYLRRRDIPPRGPNSSELS
jgi:hypothetical protein